MGKSYSASYLYAKHGDYEKKLLEAVLKSDRIDANSDEFDDVIYEFKHSQLSPYMIKILQSKNVVLITSLNPLPTQFNVFTAKDIKTDNKIKTFIDVSRIVYKSPESGKYVCKQINELVAMLISAIEFMAFTLVPQKILTSNIQNTSMEVFANMFTHIVDYLHKISLDRNTVARCKLMCCMYFAENLTDSDYDKVKFYARKFTGVSEREEDIIKMYVDKRNDVNPFLNIRTFVDFVADVLKIPTLTVDAIVEKWLFIYGTKTVFALEYWPALVTMITDAYVGCFINNQKTIEKVCGSNMVTLAKAIIDVGGSFV